jgi:diguanylate cyclase (GGDEF)-like protein
MDLKLQEIINLDDLKALMHFFYEAAGIPVGVLDENQNWLVSIGWQKICVDFHRAYPMSRNSCLRSEFRVQQYLKDKEYFAYTCPCGLEEVTIPILLEDSPIGFFFLGQFLNKPADQDYFRRQALAHGFDINSYLEALESVPIVSKDRIDHLMAFFIRFFNLLTRIGAENLQRRIAEQESQKAKEQLESRVEERTRELNNALLEVSDLAAQLNESLLEVEHLAVTDRLTETYNRRKFDEMVVYEHQRAEHGHAPFSLIMFDIDHFKLVNDQYGHSVGDEVLRQLVRLVKSLIRQSDLLIRWGGEEFLILLPTTEDQEAGAFAERIRTTVESEKFGQVENLTISLGVAQLLVNDTTDSVLKRVDNALYQAKDGGRNRVIIYSEKD